MPHNPKQKSRFGTAILWCCLAIAGLGLFVALSSYGPLQGRLGGPYAATDIVNATSLDVPPELIDQQRPSHQRDMRELRQRVKVLETELAALKRQSRPPEH